MYPSLTNIEILSLVSNCNKIVCAQLRCNLVHTNAPQKNNNSKTLIGDGINGVSRHLSFLLIDLYMKLKTQKRHRWWVASRFKKKTTYEELYIYWATETTMTTLHDTYQHLNMCINWTNISCSSNLFACHIYIVLVLALSLCQCW